VCGEMQGHGMKKYQDGSSYSGEWHRGERSGQGSWSGANGSEYEGAWLENK
jgi:hypothetical protein